MTRKIIEIAVGLLMTASIVYMTFQFYNQGRKYASSVSSKTATVLQEKEEWYVTRYEGLTPSGADVIKYIKTNIDRVDQITVVTSKKTFYADASQFSSYQVTSSDFYIDPLKTYVITVNRNKNDVITDVVIPVN